MIALQTYNNIHTFIFSHNVNRIFFDIEENIDVVDCENEKINVCKMDMDDMWQSREWEYKLYLKTVTKTNLNNVIILFIIYT